MSLRVRMCHGVGWQRAATLQACTVRRRGDVRSVVLHLTGLHGSSEGGREIGGPSSGPLPQLRLWVVVRVLYFVVARALVMVSLRAVTTINRERWISALLSTTNYPTCHLCRFCCFSSVFFQAKPQSCSNNLLLVSNRSCRVRCRAHRTCYYCYRVPPWTSLEQQLHFVSSLFQAVSSSRFSK